MSVDRLVQGWCPGALRPMPSGDGLIARVRPRGGALSVAAMGILADLAERLGNGHIDLTRRANLQLRGLAEDRLPELWSALRDLGLLDADVAAEAVRNVMVSPLSPVDPVVGAIEQALANDIGLRSLPSKFGFLVDGGGAQSIAAERADICLALVDGEMAFGLDAAGGTDWRGMVVPVLAADVAITAARAFLGVGNARRMRDLDSPAAARLRSVVAPLLSPLRRRPVGGTRRLGLLPGAVGIAAPFGRFEARQLRALVGLARAAGIDTLRPSPWRTLYAVVADGKAATALLEGAQEIGLIVDDDDPLLQVEACPGTPACVRASVDTRGDARRLATLAAIRGHRGSIHVSGCGKGCARSAPADLVLVGRADGRYGLIRYGIASDDARRSICAESFDTLFRETIDA
jgi:precorrin-3B synthase